MEGEGQRGLSPSALVSDVCSLKVSMPSCRILGEHFLNLITSLVATEDVHLRGHRLKIRSSSVFILNNGLPDPSPVYGTTKAETRSSASKESAYNAGDPGSIPGLGRSLGEGNGNSLQYSCLENAMDGGAWGATVCGVTKVRQD